MTKTFNVLKFEFAPGSDRELRDMLSTAGHGGAYVFDGFYAAALGVDDAGRVVYDAEKFLDTALDTVKKLRGLGDDDPDLGERTDDFIMEGLEAAPAGAVPLFVTYGGNDEWLIADLYIALCGGLAPCDRLEDDDVDFILRPGDFGMVKTGYVYVAANDGLKDDVLKIGQTSHEIPKRMRELSRSTSVPTPFTPVFGVKTRKYKEVEQLTHEMLKDCRLSPHKEFFKCTKDEAVAALKKVCSMADDAEFIEFDGRPRDHRAANAYKFSDRGVQVGETLVITGAYGVRAMEKTVKVVTDFEVSYCGRSMTPHALAKELCPLKKTHCVDTFLECNGVKLGKRLGNKRRAVMNAGCCELF